MEDNIILNLGGIDNARDFESHARDQLIEMSEFLPYDTRITASFNRVGDEYLVALKIKSRDLEIRDSQIDSSPYMALDLVTTRTRDQVYSWWYRRFDYATGLSS